MAMDGNKLGEEIATAIMYSGAPSATKAEVVKLWQKISNAIVDHITANAEVPAGIAVSTSGGGGATTGSGQVK